MTGSPLPKYSRPPVVETVLGVQFKPFTDFSNAHLGLFWKYIEPAWRNVEDSPTLEPIFEEFGLEKSWAQLGIQFRLSQNTGSRLWIRNDAKDRMIQLQNGRLLYNWLGHEGGPYPSYEEIRPEFDLLLDRFCKGAVEYSLGDIQPNQWELTYVNQIPRGELWETPADWNSLFSSLPGPISSPPGLSLESFGGEWHYEITPLQGRLHVQLKHGRKANSKSKADTEFLGMTLTARGPISETVDLSEGLDIGHHAIVTAFDALSSEKCHESWRKESP